MLWRGNSWPEPRSRLATILQAACYVGGARAPGSMSDRNLSMATVRQAHRRLFTIALAVAMVVGTAAVVRGATASWDPNTEPDLAGYVLSYGTQPGVHTVVIDVGNVTTYQFNPPAGRRYYVVVQAYNTAGDLSAKSAEVMVDIPAAPGVPTPPPSSGPNPTPPAAPNPNPPPSAVPGPPPAPLPNPIHPVTLVQPANQTTAVNTSAALTLTVGNLYGRALSFNATGLPPGLSISGSGVISGIATTIGVYHVSVTVSDGTVQVSGNFFWSIVSTAPPAVPRPNYPPAMDQPEPQKSPIGWAVSFQFLASDAEGQPLAFSATGLPPGLSLDRSSGLVTGSPTTLGSYEVSVTVSDGEQTTTRNFIWAIVKMTSSAAGDREADSSATAARSSASERDADAPGALSPAEDYTDVAGDFDGDGRADLATYRRSSSEWRIWTSGSNFSKPTVMTWGEAGDRPVPADYNGDRVTDFGVYRPATGTWYLSLSGTQTPLALQWGGAEDVPVPVDHDGDGKADLALIRSGGYEILLSSSNYPRSVQVR